MGAAGPMFVSFLVHSALTITKSTGAPGIRSREWTRIELQVEELELLGKVEAGMKATSSATRQIHLRESHAHDTNIYPEATVLPQVGEGKIAERVAHIAGVVKEQERERVVHGERIFCLHEHGVGRPEAVILEAAKADPRVDVLPAEGG